MKAVVTATIFPLFTFFLVFQAAAQNPPLSPEKFTALYVKELQRSAPKLKIRTISPLHLKLGKGFTVDLDNAFTRYRTHPKDRDKIIAEYTTAKLETIRAKGKSIDVSRIVPVIKDSGYIEQIRKSLRDRSGHEPDVSYAYDRYNSHLIVLYAEDTPRNIRYLTDENLANLGFTKRDRRAKAITNLEALLPKIQAAGGDGTYLIAAGGTYESSLLLFDHIWRGGKLKVKGEIVVAIPTRDLLLVTGSKDVRGLKFVRRTAARRARSGSYRLTSQLFIYRNGRFVAFNR